MKPYEQPAGAAGEPAAPAFPAQPEAPAGGNFAEYGVAPAAAQTPAPPQAPAAAAPSETAAPEHTPPGVPGGDPSAPQVIQTDADSTDGLVKCLRCGATEIALNPATGKLRCSFCRFEWVTDSVAESLNLNSDISALKGVVIGSGAADITPSTEEILTFKCSACGAEVVINTASSTQARCHWCRNKLSMNQQIPNGAVPDMILPFAMKKEDAVEKIRKFVGKRKFFAHPRFRREFSPENVMGVYLPYVVVDINAQATLRGQGEHTTRSYTVRRNDKNERRYDADVYDVWRKFDLHVSGLTVESAAERRDQNFLQNTNNVINTILPFDIENSVRYDANYLAGFTSERRDTNVEQLQPLVKTQTGDIARYNANGTLKFYDRGVRWDQEHLDLVGERWLTAYLPVWLYSYHEKRAGGKEFLHYVAVNARTGETMGSVPLNQPKLLAVSALVEVLGIIGFFLYLLVA